MFFEDCHCLWCEQERKATAAKLSKADKWTVDHGRPLVWGIDFTAAAKTKPLDIKNPSGHQTKDGRKARYLATVKSSDGIDRHVFAIREPAGHDTVQKVLTDGRVTTTNPNPNDIHDVPATPPLKVDDFWMVLADCSSYTKFRHPTYESAVKEAKRLAAKIHGTSFNVLACVGAARGNDWADTQFGSENIPF